MEIRTDFLIIGSGIAGLSFALNAAREGSVAIVTKKEHTESNTNYAQGGIASVLAPDDSFDLHIRDTLHAGAGLCRSDAVELIVREGPRMVENLMRWGVAFTKKRGGELALGREGGHSKNRIVHAADLTGREIEHVLVENVQADDHIAVYADHIAIDLITEHHLLGIADTLRPKEEQREHVTCWGAYALDTKTGQVKKFLAKIILLATGAAGQIYLHTTNPRIATGDGIAMVYRAGGAVGNLEFMQFHPTSHIIPTVSLF